VVSRSGGGDKHADESPSRHRGPRALVSISVSPIGATANNEPSRKVKRDRARSPCRAASSAAPPVVIAEVLKGTTGGPIRTAIVGVSASAAERHGSRIDPGEVSPRLRLACRCRTSSCCRPGSGLRLDIARQRHRVKVPASPRHPALSVGAHVQLKCVRLVSRVVTALTYSAVLMQLRDQLTAPTRSATGDSPTSGADAQLARRL